MGKLKILTAIIAILGSIYIIFVLMAPRSLEGAWTAESGDIYIFEINENYIKRFYMISDKGNMYGVYDTDDLTYLQINTDTLGSVRYKIEDFEVHYLTGISKLVLTHNKVRLELTRDDKRQQELSRTNNETEVKESTTTNERL